MKILLHILMNFFQTAFSIAGTSLTLSHIEGYDADMREYTERMASVIAMRKKLRNAPELVVLPGIELRSFVDNRDIPRWLELRARSLPHSVVGRPWTEQDFAREFLRRPWWGPERMRFAESRDASRRALGTITLGERGLPGRSQPSIHWLLVDPDYRRQGIGRSLVAAVEESCWRVARKTIALETLTTWTDAVKFYQALGYEAI
jgi:GNAT superfamily N-acetyltransferase